MESRLDLGNLLYDDGNLAQEGYAFSLVKKYNRSLIKAHKNRIKEGEIYLLISETFALYIEILDYSYATFYNVELIDFETKKVIYKSFRNLFKSRLLSISAFSNIKFASKLAAFEASDSGAKKHIVSNIKSFVGNDNARFDIYLEEKYDASMVNAKSFLELDKHFIYTLKKNLLGVNGYLKIGSKIYDFDSKSFATYKWFKGVMPKANEYVWANMSGKIKDKLVGFNFGYGLGSDKESSENIFYVDKKTFKLESIHIDVPISKKGGDDYEDVWVIRSDDGSVSLKFTPDMYFPLKTLGLKIKVEKNQVFGKFNGSIIVDNERYIIDDLFGVCEKNICRW